MNYIEHMKKQQDIDRLILLIAKVVIIVTILLASSVMIWCNYHSY